MHDFIEYSDLGWKMMLGKGAGELRALLPGEMLSHDIRWSADGASCVQTWTGHPALGGQFTVTTVWTAMPDGRFSGTCAFSGYAGTDFIEEIRFPFIRTRFDGGSRVIMTSFIFPNDAFAPGVPVDFPIRSIQMAAIDNADGTSLYMDWRDPQWFTKNFIVTRDSQGDTAVVEGKFFMPMGDAPESSGAVPYECSFKYYQGTWYDAAQIYKPWGCAQRWWTNRTRSNPLRDIDIWVWNRGLIRDVVPPVERLQKELPGCKVALDWYWWHHNPYDTDYPNFWPPREGEAAFREAVARLNAQGIYSQVYINGVCWDHDTGNWSDGGQDEVRLQRDGTLKEQAFNKYNNHRLAWMCGTSVVFQRKIRELVRTIHDAGLTGQYLDQIGCSSFWTCHNPKHRDKHPMGGGHYHVDGNRRMLAQIAAENPGYPLTTETGSEPYMDLVDGGIVCAVTSSERMGGSAEVIPLFQAIYHGKFITFGNFAHPDGITPWDPLWPPEDKWPSEEPWHRLFPEQFFLEMARTVIFGVQPMVCNLKDNVFSDPEFAAEKQFILDTARFYAGNKEFLCEGEMLSPDGFSCGARDVQFKYRTIFTKQDRSRVITRHLPCVLHSAWQSPDGGKALFMANYTQSPQDWSAFGQSGTIPPRSYRKITID